MNVSKTHALILALTLSAALSSCVSTPATDARDADQATPLEGSAPAAPAGEASSTKASASLDAELDALVAKDRKSVV